MRTLIIMAIALAIPSVSLAANRIIGGTETTIEQYPFVAALLLAPNGLSFSQECAGSIINIRSVLTAAQCFQARLRNAYEPYPTLPGALTTTLTTGRQHYLGSVFICDLLRYFSPSQWRVRVGSSSSSTGGAVRVTMTIIQHQNFHPQTLINDIAILRIIGAFSFNEAVAIATMPRSNIAEVANTTVTIVGWGTNLMEGPYSDTLRQKQAVVINFNTCRNEYSRLGYTMGTNVICTSSTASNAVNDACYGDTGGPVVHNNVIVSIISWTYHCRNPNYYGVNTRVFGYVTWIRTNQ